MQLLDEWQDAWNKQDVVAWEHTFHFPHFRLANGQMTVLEKPGLQYLSKYRASQPDWHHSDWNHRRIIHLSEDKVHVDTRFTRYEGEA